MTSGENFLMYVSTLWLLINSSICVGVNEETVPESGRRLWFRYPKSNDFLFVLSRGGWGCFKCKEVSPAPCFLFMLDSGFRIFPDFPPEEEWMIHYRDESLISSEFLDVLQESVSSPETCKATNPCRVNQISNPIFTPKFRLLAGSANWVRWTSLHENQISPNPASSLPGDQTVFDLPGTHPEYDLKCTCVSLEQFYKHASSGRTVSQ